MPHRAEVAVGIVVAILVLVTDLRHTIGLSAATILGYYAITNAAALRLGPSERTRTPWIARAGLVGCCVLAIAVAQWLVSGG